jgi:hypothetical protein
LWSLRGYIYILFVGSIVNLCNCCYCNSTRIMCMFRCAHYAWWAFPKRHRACCGVIATIRKVSILGRYMLLDIARPNGLRGLKHNGEVPIHRFQAAAWEPQATHQCRCPSKTFEEKLTLLQKYQRGKVEYKRYSARLTNLVATCWLERPS